MPLGVSFSGTRFPTEAFVASFQAMPSRWTGVAVQRTNRKHPQNFYLHPFSLLIDFMMPVLINQTIIKVGAKLSSASFLAADWHSACA